MAWTPDAGVVRLRDQIDAAAPHRARGADGTIGDAAHQAGTSDHNPEHPAPAGNPDYQVDALDVTHDPAHGADMAELTEAIRLSRDPRVKYVIYNRRIFSGATGSQPWVWRPYSGDDPHTNHAHVSVLDTTHDQTQDWSITMAGLTADERRLIDNIENILTTWASGRVPNNVRYKLGGRIEPGQLNPFMDLAADIAGLETVTVDVDVLAEKLSAKLGLDRAGIKAALAEVLRDGVGAATAAARLRE